LFYRQMTTIMIKINIETDHDHFFSVLSLIKGKHFQPLAICKQ
jgi:hypothetical protein